jgi:hypothetical protein
MTSRRALVTLLALVAMLLVTPPAGATDSGGAAVQSFDGTGGGIVAPVPEPGSAQAPVAEAAQETPTTPEGEEQPPDEEAPPEDEEPPEEDGTEPTPPGDDGTGGESDAGALPRTGFELAALSAIGLGLLLAGGALWPTSSWPPPRDRLSRSSRSH